MKILAIDKDSKRGILEATPHELMRLYLYRGEADRSLKGAMPKAGDEIDLGRFLKSAPPIISDGS